jgi:competence protein ComEA
MFPLSRWHAIWAAVCAVVGVIAAVPAVRRGSAAATEPVRLTQAMAAPAPVTSARRVSDGIIYVHVSGEVARPGLYRLQAGARVMDAVTGAGGATANANLDLLNLAAPLRDGLKLRVPRVGDPLPERDAAPPLPMADPVLVRPEPARPVAMGLAPSPSAFPPPTRGHAAAKFKTPGDGTVHMNTATAEVLERLPGVGPATAGSILSYRNAHGGFKTVDELMEVKGIGPKKLARMRPFLALP